MSLELFQKSFEDFVILLFLESLCLEKCKFSSPKLNKEKTEKIRDVTRRIGRTSQNS